MHTPSGPIEAQPRIPEGMVGAYNALAEKFSLLGPELTEEYLLQSGRYRPGKGW